MPHVVAFVGEAWCAVLCFVLGAETALGIAAILLAQQDVYADCWSVPVAHTKTWMELYGCVSIMNVVSVLLPQCGAIFTARFLADRDEIKECSLFTLSAIMLGVSRLWHLFGYAFGAWWLFARVLPRCQIESQIVYFGLTWFILTTCCGLCAVLVFFCWTPRYTRVAEDDFGKVKFVQDDQREVEV